MRILERHDRLQGVVGSERGCWDLTRLLPQEQEGRRSGQIVGIWMARGEAPFFKTFDLNSRLKKSLLSHSRICMSDWNWLEVTRYKACFRVPDIVVLTRPQACAHRLNDPAVKNVLFDTKHILGCGVQMASTGRSSSLGSWSVQVLKWCELSGAQCAEPETGTPSKGDPATLLLPAFMLGWSSNGVDHSQNDLNQCEWTIYSDWFVNAGNWQSRSRVCADDP